MRPRALSLLAAAIIAAGSLIAAATAAAKPNVVLIQTDDQTLEQLDARDAFGHPIMPNVLRRIGGEGVRFARYYTTDPICGPSRSSMLTGRYVHNNGILINSPPYGYPGFRASAGFNSNLATRAQASGYRTVHIGKFLNYYGDEDPAEVPPGWSDWETVVGDEGARRYYGYTLNVNGSQLGPFGSWDALASDPPNCTVADPRIAGACDYSTDVDTALAVSAIHRGAETPQPFYLQVDYNAPHVDLLGAGGPEVAPRDAGSAAGIRYRPPGYDEVDVSDKPRFLGILHRMGAEQRREVDERYERELEALREVDLGVGMILDALEASGEMANTYVFFVSDNGQFHGEHRIAEGKYLPYEPATHMPLLIRGPGIPARSRSMALAANIDLAPTIAAAAGARVPSDGQSLLRFAREPSFRENRPLLLEGYDGHPGTGAFRHHNQASVLDYSGVIAGPYKYVRYAYGQRELYDLARDPYELHSLSEDPRYRDVIGWAQRLTNRLKGCEGSGCRADAGVPPRPIKIKRWLQ